MVAMSGVCLSGASQWNRNMFGASSGTFRPCVFPIHRNDRNHNVGKPPNPRGLPPFDHFPSKTISSSVVYALGPWERRAKIEHGSILSIDRRTTSA